MIDGDGGVRQGCERAPTAGGWSHPSVATHGEGAAHQHGTADRSGDDARLVGVSVCGEFLFVCFLLNCSLK